MNEEVNALKDDIVNIFREGGIKADAARYIQEQTSLGQRQSQEWAKRIYEECRMFGSAEYDDTPESNEPQELESDLEFKENYVYNKDDDKYVFLLEKKLGKNIVLTGDIVRNIIENYSNYDDNPETYNQISVRYSIPRNHLIHIIRILGITHDSLPITPEEYMENDVDNLKEKCITGKRFALNQLLQKEDWKNTKDDAKKWNQFIVGKYNPVVDAISEWSPPPVPIIPDPVKQEVNDKVFLCVLTDTHIGELTKTCWEGKKFNTQKAVLNIQSYLSQINEKLNTWKTVPSTCKLVIMGDILNSCVDGTTRKGTKLHNDIVNCDLFKIGLDVIVMFVSSMKQMFNNVNISCVNGNHDSFMVGAVYYSASRYFENQDDIEWKISDYWLDSFKINNCFFIYTHGKDDVNHTALPRGGKLESFVQSLLLKRVEELVGVKSKYFITGHLHSYEHIELNDFEKMQVPSTVTADDFAEGLGYMTKARQNCFIVGKDSIEETLHFYFE